MPTRGSSVVFAPPPCHRLPCQMSTEPFGISAAIESYVGAVVGAVVGEVRAGDEAGRAVRLGEVGERPHRVAHGRRVRLRQRDQLVVGVDRLRVSPGRMSIDDSDEMRQPGSSTPLDDRQHVLVHRHALPDVVVREQVVDAQRLVALERVRRRAARRGIARVGASESFSSSTSAGSIASSTIV